MRNDQSETDRITTETKLVSCHYLFYMFSRQAMMGGYYLVCAVHFSTVYWLLSKGGWLASAAFAVLLVQGLLGGIFLIWDSNYRTRLKALQNMDGPAGENAFSRKLMKDPESRIRVRPLHRSINKILIMAVSSGSVLGSAVLFLAVTLPFLKSAL